MGSIEHHWNSKYVEVPGTVSRKGRHVSPLDMSQWKPMGEGSVDAGVVGEVGLWPVLDVLEVLDEGMGGSIRSPVQAERATPTASADASAALTRRAARGRGRGLMWGSRDA